jgi:uncharacterized damage-inducible protein DinB
MTWIDNTRRLYAYNEWANNRILAAAAELTDDALNRQMDGGFSTIARNLVHIVNTQVWWLSVLTATQYVGLPEPPATGTLPAIRGWFGDSHAALREYLAPLREGQLDDAVNFPDGQYANKRWVLLEHLAHHGTYHRGETATALTSLGRSPGDLDVLDFQDSLS